MGIWFLVKRKSISLLLLHTTILLLACGEGYSLQLLGFRYEPEKVTGDTTSIFSNTNNTLRLFGNGLNTSNARVVFAEEPLPYGSLCDDEKDTDPFYLQPQSDHSATIVAYIDDVSSKKKLYFCVKENDSIVSHFIHQGTDKWLSLTVVPAPPPKPSSLLPLPLQIFFICILLILSGLFSGLNLGLMSLDPMDLQIVMKSGTRSEQRFAKIIYPIRKKGNFLLCTLLLGNVLVNNTLTILLGDITSGIWAIIGSTAAIVIFGEILPQALCSRYGLNVGAYTIWLTKLFMVITFVVSYPISKILDCILGKEIGTIYNRKKLLEMLKITDPYNDLAKDEVNIIQGALELRSKVVEEVMTPINDCFMVDISATLDFETMREIMSTGYTRIPVYEANRTNIVSILFVKDLAFVDPDDCMALRSVCKFYQHSLNFVFNDITLDKLLDQFKTGTFHMAIVQRVNSEGQCDPFYEIIGIITLEDVIEEIIKSEIVDETDVYTDNKTKKLNKRRQKIPVDLSLFEQNGDDKKPKVTPQILLAAHRFLLAEVEPFKVLSDKVLLRLLKQDVVVVLNYQDKEQKSDKLCIYKKGKPSDYFVLILEGEVRVVVGKEDLEFQGGPFSYYGVPALMAPSAPPSSIIPSKQSHGRTASILRPVPLSTSDVTNNDVAVPNGSLGMNLNELTIPSGNPFQPDYKLIATSDVKYIKVTRKQYLNAVRATKMTEDDGAAYDTPTQAGTPIIGKSNETEKLETSANAKNNNCSPKDIVGGGDVEDEVSASFDVTQSHSNLSSPRKRPPFLTQHSKSMSSGQLMAIAAKYATVAGDRVNPSTLIRSVTCKEGLHHSSVDVGKHAKIKKRLNEEEVPLSLLKNSATDFSSSKEEDPSRIQLPIDPKQNDDRTTLLNIV